MKNVFTLALISYFTFPVFNNVKPFHAQSSCQATINSVVNDIKSKGVRTVLIKEDQVSEYYTNNPTNRNTELWLIMGSRNRNYTNFDQRSSTIISNIMHSKVLMKNYSDRIVSNCSQYAVVSISEEASDWTEQYALQPNGKTKLRTCVKAGSGVQLTWNQRICV
ncbi:hypothetical protein [Crocosphaera sp.]|uniref:hypothetical protein n=1 Tax=Crocosphaera sp. TaxID=2729996 RepID=UPI00261C1BF5|nr:hypothetical protein [Crocosphaera sp.]MDJ0581050.1 hypothetical protein [Crocosphaera sp.]